MGIIIGAVVTGLIIGSLGRLVLPGKQDISLGMTILVGIAAAVVGGVAAAALGVGETGGVDWIKLVIQVGLAAAGVTAYISYSNR